MVGGSLSHRTYKREVGIMAHATRFNGATVPTYRENLNRSKAVLPATGSSTTPPPPLQGHHRATGHRLHHYAGTTMTSASMDRMVTYTKVHQLFPHLSKKPTHDLRFRGTVVSITQFTNPANPDTHFRWTGNVSSSM